MFDSKLFSASIKAQLLLRKVSLREAAKETGISASTISRLTNGDTPDMENFATLVRWLDVDANQFFGHTGDHPVDDGWTPLYYDLQALGAPEDLIDAIVTVVRLVAQRQQNRIQST